MSRSGQDGQDGQDGQELRKVEGAVGEAAREAWERRTQTTLLWLAVAFAVAYATPIVHADAGDGLRRACLAVEWLVWAAFAADYAIRLRLSRRRWAFLRGNPVALVAVALPLLQPLRLLRVLSALLLVGHRARLASQVRLTTYVVGACVALLMFGSLAVLEVERDAPGSTIHTMGDAMWWAFTTMTTVGYGDLAPTTGLGRLLAVGLMLSGIALLGVVTANIAAWFVSRFERDNAENERQTAAIEELAAEVRTLRAEVARLAGARGPRARGADDAGDTGDARAAGGASDGEEPAEGGGTRRPPPDGMPPRPRSAAG
ncbi:potassium channel family protein [Streptomyces sp. 4N509B]|uniref:potassium channel family protein n=1 Tax=Streptomyces sp. 4N509B TaxID=3457413 RepID=UPI003FD518FE